MSHSFRFALVEWVEGEDSGSRSILNIDCIRNFSVLEYCQSEGSEPRLVEWRSGRKPWPVFRARIIQIAKHEKTLHRKLWDLEAKNDQVNKKRTPKPNPRYMEEEEGCPEEEENGPPTKKKATKAKFCKPFMEEEGDGEDGEVEALGGEHRKATKTKTASEARKEQDQIMWENRKWNQMLVTMQELRHENAALKRENEKLKDLLINHIPQMKEDIATIAAIKANSCTPLMEEEGDNKVGELEAVGGDDSPSTNKKPTLPNPEPATDSEKGDKENKIEVLKGSGVLCRKAAYKASMLANTPTAMIRTLLLGSFDLDTLLASNLNGGKPRRGDGEQLVALDPTKKMAIMEATLKKWPHATRGQLGMAINMKLTELRRKKMINN